MAFDVAVIVIVAVVAELVCWLASDLLWDRWHIEQDKEGAKQLTWLIGLNMAASVVIGIGLALLVLRTTVW